MIPNDNGIYIHMFYYFVATLSKERQRWYQFHIRVIKNNQMIMDMKDLEGEPGIQYGSINQSSWSWKMGPVGRRSYRSSSPNPIWKLESFPRTHLQNDQLLGSKVSHGRIWFKN